MSDEGATPDAESDYPDSGPFCRHWGDPSDCDDLCACGHRCCQHEYYGDACEMTGCPCMDFKDAPSPAE